MSSPTYLGNIAETVATLQEVAGCRFRGSVNGGECIELVFDERPGDWNLVSIFVQGRRAGEVWYGYLSQELIDNGYFRP